MAEPLVFYRVGATAFKRRGGAGLLRSELRLQREFVRSGFTSRAEYVRDVLIRGSYRLIPWWLRRAVYRPLVALLPTPCACGRRAGRRPRSGDAEVALPGHDRCRDAARARQPREPRSRRRRVRLLRADSRGAMRQRSRAARPGGGAPVTSAATPTASRSRRPASRCIGMARTYFIPRMRASGITSAGLPRLPGTSTGCSPPIKAAFIRCPLI